MYTHTCSLGKEFDINWIFSHSKQVIKNAQDFLTTGRWKFLWEFSRDFIWESDSPPMETEGKSIFITWPVYFYWFTHFPWIFTPNCMLGIGNFSFVLMLKIKKFRFIWIILKMCSTLWIVLQKHKQVSLSN